MDSHITKKSQALLQFIGSLLRHLDEEEINLNDTSRDYNKASKYMKDFFKAVLRSYYSFFVEEDRDIMQAIS